jgi:Xaa-Pro aminopeptidase
MLDPSVFAERRRAYMDVLGPDAIAIACSLPERLRNGDSRYAFRQHSDVYYLTGFGEPEAVVILRPGAEQDRVVMFVRPRDAEQEQWEGRRAGIEGACERYGADAAYPIAELGAKLWELIANTDELHYSLGLDPAMDATVAGAVARLRKLEKKGHRPPRAIVDPRVTLHELRLHKRPEELHLLRRAADITCDAHVDAMRAGRPGTFEYELQAIIEHTFRRRGGAGPGYTTIVGTGENATVLHYVENNRAIADGDLVLVDAGCEYDHYTADVTRTFPAGGRFTGAGRAMYEVVLAVQTSAIAMVRPGITIDDIHDHCVRGLTDGMIRLGLLDGGVDERIADLAYKRFFMHGTSHWLGMDVHDVGAYTRGGAIRPLEPGMVITVEPGLYVTADADGVPDALRGIGVRIEDDVLVTEAGHDVLTARCPKQIADVEAACRG